VTVKDVALTVETTDGRRVGKVLAVREAAGATEEADGE